MKAKIEFGQFVDSLVEAKGMIDRAAVLEHDLESMANRKQGLIDELRKVAEDVAAATAGAHKRKEILAAECEATKIALEQSLAAFRKATHDETQTLKARTDQALREAQQAVAMAQSDAQTARADAATAQRELVAITADLASARADAAKLARYAGVGKA